jgi:N-succinyldiaminopimelate aminotransferase
VNRDLDRLHRYPFERLNRLLADAPRPPCPVTDLAIGEPREPTPGFILDALAGELPASSRYPLTRGGNELRRAAAAWLARRFAIPADLLDPDRHILPVNGTREALFSFAQCAIDRTAEDPVVVLPNPFYQIYEGAALLAGARPWYVAATPSSGYRSDFSAVPDSIWRKCQLLYLCSPANPTGSVLEAADLDALLGLSEQHGFIIAADECYSEIFPDEDRAPAGLLQEAVRAGRPDFRNCIVFHSLSKRSSMPGLRSGFVAGDAQLMRPFHLYRTYHGCAMPPPIQAASVAAWSDETHVRENRQRYRERFDAVIDILRPCTAVNRPEGGFYLWLRTPGDDERFARTLYEKHHVRVLPGSYLGRVTGGDNPGAGHVRIALVAPLEECVRAAMGVRELMESDEWSATK